jgi:hypothetical protein
MNEKYESKMNQEAREKIMPINSKIDTTLLK